MSDKDLRATDILERFSRERREKEELLVRFERISVRGVVLIDGNHLLLESLADVDSFNQEYGEQLASGKVFNPWENPEPQDLAEYVAIDLIFSLSQNIASMVAQTYTSGEKVAVLEYDIVEGGATDPSKTLAVNAHADVMIFDAKMPKRTDCIEQFERNWNLFKRTMNRKAMGRLEEALDLVKANKWRLWHDGQDRTLPYDFKNKFLEALSSDEKWPVIGWKARYGERKIDVRTSGFNVGDIRQREKGVDTQLVIAGCDAAQDRAIDWVCLVTNDGDYVPLVEKLKSEGKTVFWMPLIKPRMASGDLKSVVGRDNFISKGMLLNQHQEGYVSFVSDPEYRQTCAPDAKRYLEMLERSPAASSLRSIYVDKNLDRDFESREPIG